MAFVFPVGNIVEVRLWQRVNNQSLINVLHYTNTGGYNYTNLSEALTDLLDNVNEPANGNLVQDIAALQSNTLTHYRQDAQYIYPTRWRAISQASNIIGNAEGPCPAQNVQLAVEKFSDTADRHSVGGIRIGGLPAAAYAGGLVAAAYEAPLAQVADDVATNITSVIDEAIIWRPVILNREKVVVDGKNHWNITGFKYVYGAVAKDEVRTMNRRTINRGI